MSRRFKLGDTLKVTIASGASYSEGSLAQNYMEKSRQALF